MALEAVGYSRQNALILQIKPLKIENLENNFEGNLDSSLNFISIYSTSPPPP